MEKYYSLLKNTSLFGGLEQNELVSMLKCLSAYRNNYEKDQFIFRNGQQVSHIGLVLSGTVLIVKEDFWGNRAIISEVSRGSLFAETYACVPSKTLEVSVIAASDCEILFLDVHKILTVCSSVCEFHTRLIQNLLSAISLKNLILTKKMEHMSQKTTRDKLLSYLSNESMKTNNSTFEIPFNRQQLADYLSVDRSAMSNELGKLRDEGILSFKKNYFTLNYVL